MTLKDIIPGLEGPAVMAVLNVTPDSFFSGSRNFSEDAVCMRIREAVDQGAGMIDVGGYSTRPGAPEVEPEEELERVLRGVCAVREIAPGIPVSVDTFRARVAEGVLVKFPHVIINDISAGELDHGIIDVVAHYEAPYIAMHMRATPTDMQQHTAYGDVVGEITEYLQRRAEYLQGRGVKRLILDPGFGFAKTTAQNYELLSGLDRIYGLGYPVLAGVSRKSMIYKLLGTSPEQALAGTTALNWECLRKGAAILRVHDVREAADVVKLFKFYSENGGA